MIAWRERIAGVRRRNHVRPIRQAGEYVITRTVRCGTGARRPAQRHCRSIAGRRRIDRAGYTETCSLERVATMPVVTLGVGRIDLVIVGRAGRQTGKRHLVARNHRRINWRTSSVGRGGSVRDRRVGRSVCCPNDLRARGCHRPGLYVRNDKSRRRGRVVGTANQT